MTMIYEQPPLGYGVNRQKHQRETITPPKPIPYLYREPLASLAVISFAVLIFLGALKAIL